MGWCKEADIRILTMWAFSTDNFRRDETIVEGLFGLFKGGLKKIIEGKEEKKLKIGVFGRLHLLPWGMQMLIKKAKKMSDSNGIYQFNRLLSYGGREEIVDAVNEILSKGVRKVDEKIISDHLYTRGLPDPDLIIRTSDEQRLSGLMPWQSCYSELYFCKKLWPEFSKRDFHKALRDFAKRKRKYGR